MLERCFYKPWPGISLLVILYSDGWNSGVALGLKRQLHPPDALVNFSTGQANPHRSYIYRTSSLEPPRCGSP